MGRIYQVLASASELERAWQKVCRKGGQSAGSDRVTLTEFKVNLHHRLEKLSRALQRQSYVPKPLVLVQIPKSTPGQWREIGIPAVADRVVAHSAVEALHYLLERHFLSCSCAYRPGRGVNDALGLVRGNLQEGCTWIVRGDICGCFDTLRWEILFSRLDEYVRDAHLVALLKKFIIVPYRRGKRTIRRSRGVPQGMATSPVLANLYLHRFDEILRGMGMRHVRYGDDWMIFCSSRQDARSVWRIADEVLVGMGVRINEAKSGIYDLERDLVDFLGFRVGRGRIDGGPAAWERAYRAQSFLQNPTGDEERKLVLSQLRGIAAQYRSAGCWETGTATQRTRRDRR